MPCFNQVRSVGFRSQRDKAKDKNGLPPKFVRPRNMKFHGLFGHATAQHLIVDERWTHSSLAEQFMYMRDLLKRNAIYRWHLAKSNRAFLLRDSKRLKAQCADGRVKLQKISFGNSAHAIRNCLIHHREMQRLYQKMPLYQIADNINQRTFVMRKERDRLEFRLGQLKQKFKDLLVGRSKVENLIKFENMFMMEEELQSLVLLKKIQNSNVRMRAIRTINTTYRKMLKVLLHDEIFYEPILHSLDDDMEDQSNFIKHILYLGMPAISKFRVLNHEFRKVEEKSRQNLQAKLQILNSLKKPLHIGPPQIKVREILTADPKRYVRQTQSMEMLKTELQSIEQTIKDLKLTVLCSQAKEIYPRVKEEVENNKLLHRSIEHNNQLRTILQSKIKYTNLLKGVLINNLSEEELNRIDRIKELEGIMKSEKNFERETLEFIKSRADVYVMLRFFMWNLIEVLRSIDRLPRAFRKEYPKTYLKLPLLKFDFLNMFASPPEFYEENVDTLMHLMKRKVYKLTMAFKPGMEEHLKHSIEQYHETYMTTANKHRSADYNADEAPVINSDLLQDKTTATIPSRKQIKAQSARLVEEASKLEEV